MKVSNSASFDFLRKGNININPSPFTLDNEQVQRSKDHFELASEKIDSTKTKTPKLITTIDNIVSIRKKKYVFKEPNMKLPLIKTRQLLICMFITDFNSIVIKLSFFFFVFGICLGINTIFIDDRAIQKIYEENKDYNILKHIITHIMNIGISTIVASLIKSIVLDFQSLLIKLPYFQHQHYLLVE